MNSLNEIPRTPQENEFYNYLLLSIYFYLKHNNYNLTAENLFNEGNLGSVFKFPQEVQEGTNENEILQKKFIQHFYYNSFFKSQDSFDLVSDFWNQFWEIFAIKIKQNNQTISPMDKYLLQEKGKLKLTCIYFFILL